MREVAEEAGVQAEVIGVMGMRSRYDPENGNSMYVVMLLKPLSGEPTPDGREVDQAGYFTLDEIEGLVQVPSINLEVARRVLSPDPRLHTPVKVLHASGAMYTLFLG